MEASATIYFSIEKFDLSSKNFENALTSYWSYCKLKQLQIDFKIENRLKYKHKESLKHLTKNSDQTPQILSNPELRLNLDQAINQTNSDEAQSSTNERSDKTVKEEGDETTFTNNQEQESQEDTLRNDTNYSHDVFKENNKQSPKNIVEEEPKDIQIKKIEFKPEINPRTLLNSSQHEIKNENLE